MKRSLPTLLAAVLFTALALTGTRASAQQIVPTGDLPLTVAESSGFTRTATFEDVWAWFKTLQGRGADFTVKTIGTTTEGRAMPLVIVSRPLVTTPAEAKASGKPILYLQGNIHAGEVEGKDALLMFLRDVTVGGERALLDRVILLIDPIYNADGNEQWGPVARNRPGQDGPEEVGQRPNGMGLDLNRDCMKAESPEFQAVVTQVLDLWEPDIVMDLHTTNGSYHGYDLTYAASLTPTAPQGPVDFTNDVLFPELTRRLARKGHPLFDYGNHGRGNPPTEWRTFGWEPRYVSNYNGLRGSISILSEAVSYRSFRTRVSATYWLVRETVEYAGSHGAQIRKLVSDAREQVRAWGADPSAAPELGVRFQMVSSGKQPVTYEVVQPPAAGQRGRGTRTGEIRSAPMDVYNRFEATLTRSFPAGYLVPAAYPEAIHVLQLHGIRVERLDAPWTGTALSCRVDTLDVQTRAYQGHRMVTVEGSWSEGEQTVPAGTWYVPCDQPLGALAFSLLEPEIEDGLVAWNYFDRGLSERRPAPVLKVMKSVDVPRHTPGR